MAPQNPKQGGNPVNRESQLFKALTRLFSGPIINYRSESGRKIRRQHLDKFSSRFRSASGQQFKKQSYNPLDTIAANAIANQRRSERYIDFDQMEYTPEIASSLDIYADEMTTFSDLSPMLNIRCANDEIKAVLRILYKNVMNIEYNLFGWCRTMCKYGDFVLYLDIDDEVGVKSTIALPIQEIERLEGMDATNPNYVQYQWNSAGMTFENWQVAHFRILGNDKYAPYGTSVLEPARRIWRQLTLMEDAMMAYRIVRSSERKVFKIDVGAIPPQEVEQYMQKIVTQLKRHTIVDKDTGRVDLRYNPMSIEEDYYIPIRAGSVTDIQNLAGGTNTTAIDDVKYLRDKLFSALKVPQSYLTMGEGATEDKTTLATKDIRFARTISNIGRLSSTSQRQRQKASSLAAGLPTTSLGCLTKSSYATSAKCTTIASTTLTLNKSLKQPQQAPGEAKVVILVSVEKRAANWILVAMNLTLVEMRQEMKAVAMKSQALSSQNLQALAHHHA